MARAVPDVNHLHEIGTIARVDTMGRPAYGDRMSSRERIKMHHARRHLAPRTVGGRVRDRRLPVPGLSKAQRPTRAAIAAGAGDVL